MDTLVTLSAVELERLLITIESSMQVHLRHQYYLWSQGTLQGFLPHDLLIYGFGDYGTPGFRCEILARANALEVSAPSGELARLIGLMIEHWQGTGGLPRYFKAGEGSGLAGVIGQALAVQGLGHALVHGTREFTGTSAGYFFFLRMADAPGYRQAYFAELLMPYLHTALHRMLMTEKSAPERRGLSTSRLSAREAQVIGLVRDGKTNQEIAAELELSPLTVKNHVQNILRKLQVANRTQAVAKAVKSRLIGDNASPA